MEKRFGACKFPKFPSQASGPFFPSQAKSISCSISLFAAVPSLLCLPTLRPVSAESINQVPASPSRRSTGLQKKPLSFYASLLINHIIQLMIHACCVCLCITVLILSIRRTIISIQSLGDFRCCAGKTRFRLLLLQKTPFC